MLTTHKPIGNVGDIGIFIEIFSNESKSCQKVKLKRIAWNMNVHIAYSRTRTHQADNKNTNDIKRHSRLMGSMAFSAVKQRIRQISYSWDDSVYWTYHKFQMWLWDHTTLLFHSVSAAVAVAVTTTNSSFFDMPVYSH